MATKSESDTQADLDSLREDLKTLREDVNTLVKHLGSDAKKATQNARARVDETIREQSERLERKAEDHPLTALGVALGAGVILGIALRR